MVAILSFVDSDGKLSSFDTLLDDDIIIENRRLCFEKFSPVFDFFCCERASSSIRFDDEWVAHKGRWKFFYKVSTCDKERTRYFHTDFFYEEIGSVFIDTQSMHHK